MVGEAGHAASLARLLQLFQLHGHRLHCALTRSIAGTQVAAILVAESSFTKEQVMAKCRPFQGVYLKSSGKKITPARIQRCRRAIAKSNARTKADRHIPLSLFQLTFNFEGDV